MQFDFAKGGVSWLVRLLPSVVPIVFLVAAIAKFVGWDAYETSLTSFVLISPRVLFLAAVLLPGAELAAFLLFANRLPLLANVWSVVLLLFLTGVVAWHWLNNTSPQCACFGPWMQFAQSEEAARAMLLRNSVLIVVAIGAVAACVHRPGEREQSDCAVDDAGSH